MWSPTCTESKPTASAARANSVSSRAPGTPDEYAPMAMPKRITLSLPGTRP